MVTWLHGHKVQKHIEGDRVANVGLHSIQSPASSFYLASAH